MLAKLVLVSHYFFFIFLDILTNNSRNLSFDILRSVPKKFIQQKIASTSGLVPFLSNNKRFGRDSIG